MRRDRAGAWLLADAVEVKDPYTRGHHAAGRGTQHQLAAHAAGRISANSPRRGPGVAAVGANDSSTDPDRMRHLVDTQGREWHVYERTAADYSPLAGHPSLIFDTEGIVRRVWRYPSSWSALPDADLLGLMDTVRPSRPIV